MDKKKILKEYWDVFCTKRSVEDNNDVRDRLRIALRIVTIFSFLLALINILARDYSTCIVSILLGILFTADYFVVSRTKKYNVANIVCMLGLGVAFTYYIFTGGSEGFSVLWTLIAPVFVMACIGVKYGTFLGGYLLTLMILLFWTPLRASVEMYYTETFLWRFPLLYLCMLLVSLLVMLSLKRTLLYLDESQNRLEAAVRDEHNRATRIFFQTVGAIIDLIDAKDAYTDDHSLRVAQYALMLAEEMGWDQDEIEKLYYTALLHDIGKVGIHDAILKKKARLSDSEYQIMKTHTSIGAMILKEMEFIENVDEGALYHHEKYDGTGYPFGLKGDEIPMSARIICLADSFDAMNTARVYRTKCNESYIIDEIRNGRGTQFDPEVVDAFFRCLDKGLIMF